MATFDTEEYAYKSDVDYVTGNKVKDIMEKYLDEVMSEELCDRIIADIKAEFGEDHPAQVNLDDEINEIEIIVRDRNDKWIKCSSLTLFPKDQ